MGATTVWERWDSMLPDGSINPGEMTSFNHYALGAVADWLHRTVAGLAPAAPGYREIARPAAARRAASPPRRPGTSRRTARPRSRGRRAGGALRLSVTVPVGARADGRTYPARPSRSRSAHGTHEWDVADPYAEQPALPADATIRQLHRPRAELGRRSPRPPRRTAVVTDDAAAGRPAGALPRRAPTDLVAWPWTPRAPSTGPRNSTRALERP